MCFFKHDYVAFKFIKNRFLVKLHIWTFIKIFPPDNTKQGHYTGYNRSMKFLQYHSLLSLSTDALINNSTQMIITSTDRDHHFTILGFSNQEAVKKNMLLLNLFRRSRYS